MLTVSYLPVVIDYTKCYPLKQVDMDNIHSRIASPNTDYGTYMSIADTKLLTKTFDLKCIFRNLAIYT